MALIDRPAARALRRTPEVAEPAVSAAEEAVSDTVPETLPATEVAASEAPEEADIAGFSARDSNHAALAGSSRHRSRPHPSDGALIPPCP